MTKSGVIDFIILAVLLIAICTVGKVAKADNACYATCHQFESALLVGCYLSDFEGRKLQDKAARLIAFDRHEKYCRKMVKEIMGKDSGCN